MKLKQLQYVDSIESPVKQGQIALDWIRPAELLKGSDSADPRSGNLNQNSVRIQKNVQIIDENLNVLNQGLEDTDKRLQKVIDDLDASETESLIQKVHEQGLMIVENDQNIQKNAEGLQIEQTRVNTLYGILPTFEQALITETQRATNEENALQAQINSIGQTGGRGYKTYALMEADKANIQINTYSKVTNDPDASKNGDWQWDGTTFTKSPYDPVSKIDFPVVISNNLYTGTNKLGFYVRPADGFIIASTVNELTVIPVEENETYAITAADMRTQYVVCSFSDTSSVSGGKQNKLGVLNATIDPLVKTFVVPAGMKYVFINTVWPNFNLNIKSSLIVQKGLSIRKVVKSNIGFPVMDQLAHDILNDMRSKGVLTKTEVLPSSNGLVIPTETHLDINISPTTGALRPATGCKVARFDVKPLHRYKITAPDLRPAYFAATTSTKKTVDISTAQTLMSLIEIDENTKIFIAPADAVSGCVNTVWPNFALNIESTLVIEELDINAVTNISGVPIYDLDAHSRIKNLEENGSSGGGNYVSVLKGKKWVFIGDSITDDRNSWATKRYHDYVVESVGGMITQNLGISSSGYGDRTLAADAITIENPDYITLFMGTNDFGYLNDLRNSQGKPYPMGDFLSLTNLTVSGAINTTLTNIFKKYPLAKVAIITPLPRGTRAGGSTNPSPNFGENPKPNKDGVSLEDIANELIRYARHYSLPVLDLYHHSNFHGFSEEFQTECQPDGVHPNNKGHLLFGQKVLKLLESM